MARMMSLFPHLTATGQPPTSQEVMDAYRSAFTAQVAQGTMRPLVIPYHLYGYLFLVVYLCLPHTKRPWVYTARWPVLGLIWWWQWKTLWEVTSMSMATGFAVGLVSMWGMVWATTWLVFYRPQFDAKRVQRRWVKKADVQSAVGEGAYLNGTVKSEDTLETTTSTALSHEGNGKAVLWRPNRRHVKPTGASGHTSMNGEAKQVLEMSNDGLVAEYYWQAYPEDLTTRISWVFDLIANFRGPGWNWAIPPLPSLPPAILNQLSEPLDASSKTGESSIGLRRYDTYGALARARLPGFIIGYFLLDILKVTMMSDPYFIFGPTTYALPPLLSNLSPLALRFLRQVISSLSIILSLEMVFRLAPLIFSLILGPKVLGIYSAPFLHPTTWGSLSSILDKGLNGLWGSWWHQTFRHAFSAPSNYLIANGYLKAHSPAARIAALVFAFGISGVLHAGGSISQFPDTKHWHAPIFFMLQAVGIFIQSTACSILHSQLKTLPRSVRRGGNFIFVFAWLFWTGWWLTDDFARGGVWLYEPIPISPLRGLGFSEKGTGWWCWEHLGVGWYHGRSWWESGIAL